ncbi:hypothetical protein FQR65_LT20921 [Abscondita terminalis]|nr:hypothetical protein FQR65_LT20921 [Abscondita terminalis]
MAMCWECLKRYESAMGVQGQFAQRQEAAQEWGGKSVPGDSSSSALSVRGQLGCLFHRMARGNAALLPKPPGPTLLGEEPNGFALFHQQLFLRPACALLLALALALASSAVRVWPLSVLPWGLGGLWLNESARGGAVGRLGPTGSVSRPWRVAKWAIWPSGPYAIVVLARGGSARRSGLGYRPSRRICALERQRYVRASWPEASVWPLLTQRRAALRYTAQRRRFDGPSRWHADFAAVRAFGRKSRSRTTWECQFRAQLLLPWGQGVGAVTQAWHMRARSGASSRRDCAWCRRRGYSGATLCKALGVWDAGGPRRSGSPGNCSTKPWAWIGYRLFTVDLRVGSRASWPFGWPVGPSHRQ